MLWTPGALTDVSRSVRKPWSISRLLTVGRGLAERQLLTRSLRIPPNRALQSPVHTTDVRGHIHGRERQGKNGKTVLWYAVVDVGGGAQGRRQQKWHGGFKTHRAAEQAMAELVRSLENQTYVPPTRTTLAGFVHDEWLPTMASQVKPSTWDSYRRNLENHVLPVLGGRQLQAITGGHLNSLYQSLLTGGRRNGPGGGLAPKTVRNIHIAISKLLADALDRGLVGRNVAAMARPPEPRTSGPKEIRFWTPEELSAFLDFTGEDRPCALWRLGAMTGMRRGELLGLRWEDIDEQAKRLSVRQALISVAYKIMITTPKSHIARVIDLDPATLDALGQHRQRQEAEKAAHGPGYHATNLVFRQTDGTMIHPDVLRTIFDRRVARSGVRRIRFHDLLHTHATIGLRAGVHVKVMSERLGHSTPAFTMQQYAAVIPGMQAEAAEAIANLVAAGSGPLPSPEEQRDNDDDDDGPEADATEADRREDR